MKLFQFTLSPGGRGEMKVFQFPLSPSGWRGEMKVFLFTLSPSGGRGWPEGPGEGGNGRCYLSHALLSVSGEPKYSGKVSPQSRHWTLTTGTSGDSM